VTGGAGMLGSTLVPMLREAGHEVVTVSRGAGTAPAADFRADLSRPGEALRVLGTVKPAAVVHLAAATDVDLCEREPDLAYRQNVLAAELLAQACGTAASPVHLVHVSTDHLYDGSGAHAESDVTVRNHYAMSKLAGEYAALRHAAATVLRVNFVGRSACPGRTSFSDWVVASLRAGKAIQVFDDVRFSPLRMHTLAGVIVHVLAHPSYGVFNTGSRGATTKADMAFLLANGLGLDTGGMRRTSIRDAAGLAPRPAGMAMDSSRFAQAFAVALPGTEEEMSALIREYSSEVRP
jgi:dTDP-4-dehydrorhamnose reductase